MNERKVGILLSYIQVALSVLVNLIYVPVLLHFLGKREYGLYQIVGSFFSYITVFESSMSSGVLKNYCAALDNQDQENCNEILYSAKRIYEIMAALIGVAGIILLFVFRSFYKSSFTLFELQEGSVILVILFFNAIITILGSVYLTTISGNERFIFNKSLNIVIQIIQPFLVILLVRKIPYAVVIVSIMTSLNFIAVISRYLYSKNKLHIRISKCDVNKATTVSIISLSATILFASIADQIFWKTDQVILGKIYNTAKVAVYSVGSQIYMIYMQFGIQIPGVYFPKTSALYQQNDGIKKVSNLFVSVGRAVFFVILLILSGFILFGNEFLQLWVGNGYQEAYYVALFVMIPFSIDLSQNLGLSILQITGQYGFRAKIYFLGAVLNIVSTVFMSIYLGIVGAALSTGLTMIVTSGIIMNWYYDKKVGLDIKKFWAKSLPIILASVALTLIVSIIKSFTNFSSQNFFALILEIFVYILAYTIVMYVFVMNEEEKKSVIGFLKKKKYLHR